MEPKKRPLPIKTLMRVLAWGSLALFFLFFAYSAVCGMYAEIHTRANRDYVEVAERRANGYYQLVPQWTPDSSLVLYDKGLAFRSAPAVVSTDRTSIRWFDDLWPHTEPTSVRYWHLSPDGARIVFTTYGYSKGLGWEWEGNKGLEIATSHLDGSGRKRLTKNGVADYVPVWSPNGSHIAFLSSDPGREERLSLYTINSHEANIQRLTYFLDLAVVPPAWSSDGQKIAFLAYGDNRYMYAYVVDADGQNLVNLGKTISHPVWEPGGERIAIVKLKDASGKQSAGLYLIDLDNHRKSREVIALDSEYYFGSDGYRGTLEPGVCWINNFSWSPDGSEILYGGRCHGYYVVNANTAQVRDLIERATNQVIREYDAPFTLQFYAEWSPEGSRIAINSGSALYLLHREATWHHSGGNVLVSQDDVKESSLAMYEHSKNVTPFCFDNSLILWRLIVDCRGAPK